MAIARDTQLHFGGAVGSALSTAYTCTGSNRALVLFAYHEGTTTGTATYNGVSLTKIASTTNNIPSHIIDVFVLMNPASGSNTLTFTPSSSTFRDCWALSYTGTAQTGQPDASDAPAGSVGSSKSSTITTVASGAWIVAYGENDNGFPTTATGTVSKIATDASIGTIIMDSNGSVTPGGNAYGFSGGGTNGDQALISVSLSPVAAVVNANFLSFM